MHDVIVVDVTGSESISSLDDKKVTEVNGVEIAVVVIIIVDIIRWKATEVC